MAARVLDSALRKHPNAPAVDRARALAARAEIAIATSDAVHAAQLQAELAALVLSDGERARQAASSTPSQRPNGWPEAASQKLRRQRFRAAAEIQARPSRGYCTVSSSWNRLLTVASTSAKIRIE
jgi:GAF domain-containing protein